MSTVPTLRMQGIRKEFSGVLALDGVSLDLLPGEVHALMGENGAGKSTLLKVLTGVHACDTGSIELNGRTISPRTPAHAQELGISAVYQEINLIPSLSVSDNIALNRQPMRFGFLEQKASRTRAAEAVARLGLTLDLRRPVGSYSIAIQQLVAIARALDTNAKVLVLDEPTSSLDRAEVERLFKVVQSLKAEGLAIVFVSHFLDQVYEISDRITVLRNGKGVGTFRSEELSKEALISLMLGRQPSVENEAKVSRIEQDAGENVLSARGLGRKRQVEPYNLDVRKGEVLGFAGLLGSGRTEAVSLLFGSTKADTGSICLSGQEKKVTSPRVGLKAGIGLVPEDRKIEGVFPNLSIRENIALAAQARRGWLRRVGKREQVDLADRFIKALRIAAPNRETPVGRLSGGNQQKVVLARWLAAQPQLLILDEPTRGVDVGAKEEIEKLTAQLCADGLAVILVATDLEEVVRDSHRVVVMRDRKKVGEVSGDGATVENLVKMIAGDAR